MKRLDLSVAVGNYDRTRALTDGRARIDGANAIVSLLSPEEMFFRAFRHQDYDVSELSLSSYCVSVAKGDPHYVAVPVFLSRAFRHTSIYVNANAGIDEPADLRGKRIGIAEYQLSANVWVRGILERDHGVRPADIQWMRGGMDSPGRPEKLSLNLPDDVRIDPIGVDETLNELLASGGIDGFIGPRAPRCFAERHPDVRRLFTNSIDAAADWYRRTQVFPIMHVLGLRRSLADAHPWLPGALLKAFSEAKDLAMDALRDTSATKVTMPFVEDTLGFADELMGRDFWSYGFAANEKTLSMFCDIHHAQGLSPRRLQPEELFHPSTLESYSL